MLRAGESPQTEEQRQARAALNKGVQDFKNGQFEGATQDLLRAKQLHLRIVNARLYLATTYAAQYIPGAPSEENLRRGRAAAEEFRGALALDPQNLYRKHSRAFSLLHFGGEAAAVELDGYGIAESDLGGVAEEVADGVGGDGVAAFENAQGAALLELQG